jgi:hypothetical protein
MQLKNFLDLNPTRISSKDEGEAPLKILEFNK